MKSMREMVKDSLMEAGFNLDNFDQDYETAIDNYHIEYDCANAEDHDDFWSYCVDNWSDAEDLLKNESQVKELKDLEIGTLVHGYDTDGELVTAIVNDSAEFGKYYGNYEHDMSDSVEVNDIDYDYCYDYYNE